MHKLIYKHLEFTVPLTLQQWGFHPKRSTVSYNSLVPRPHPQGGKRVWGLAGVFLVVHCQQSCFQVNQSDHSFSTVI